MILQYDYWYFQSVIPPEICDKIIEIGLTSIYDQEEKYGKEVSNASTGGWKEKNPNLEIAVNSESVSDLKKKGVDLTNVYVRDSNVTFLNIPELYDILWPYIHKANEKANWNFDWDYTEDMQFTKYGPGQFYGWHTDSSAFPYRMYDSENDKIHLKPDGTPYLDMFGQPMYEDHNVTENPKMVGKTRKLSLVLSLSDPNDYKGGNLRFDFGPHNEKRYHTCKEIRPRGSIVVFPSHIYHQVTPVKSGKRYTLVAWSLGAPFK